MQAMLKRMLGGRWRAVSAAGGPGRESLLAAVAVKNAAVREKRLMPESKRLGASVLRLTAALSRGGAGGAGGREKSFELDELGAFVWDAADGTRTVEGLIRHFAAEKKVNLREAEVAVLAFLKMLAKRNLMALRVEGGNAEAERRSAK